MRWGVWLAHAQRVFGITPEKFWRLSVSEWRALTAQQAETRLGPDEFAALAARFPDCNNG